MDVSRASKIISEPVREPTAFTKKVGDRGLVLDLNDDVGESEVGVAAGDPCLAPPQPFGMENVPASFHDWAQCTKITHMSRNEDEPQDAVSGDHDVRQPEDAKRIPLGSEEQEQAAQLIQRNYRGYRQRRQLQGMGLDANSRWTEVCASLCFSCPYVSLVPIFSRLADPHRP